MVDTRWVVEPIELELRRSAPFTDSPPGRHGKDREGHPDQRLSREAVPSSFLEKMRSVPDGDGSLLDHSLLVYGSPLSDGNMHLLDLPVLLVAGGATRN